MFDLPTLTSMERRNYRDFRKFLVKEGFVMMQESIYSKICINQHAVDKVMLDIRKKCPPHGIVQVLSVTERQFANMKFLVGESNDSYLQSEDRIIIL